MNIRRGRLRLKAPVLIGSSLLLRGILLIPYVSVPLHPHTFVPHPLSFVFSLLSCGDEQMHKTRAFLPPIPPIAPGSYDLYNPSIRLIALPQSSLKITGPFADLTKAIRDGAEKRAGRKIEVAEDEIVVPVHELQVWHVKDKFPEARILDQEFSVPARAQQSIRLVVFFSSHLLFALSHMPLHPYFHES